MVTGQRNVELSWVDRARVIFFHLHPQLGGRDIKSTAKLFQLNQRTSQHNHTHTLTRTHTMVDTISSWLTNKRLIPKWFHIVSSMDAGEVRTNIILLNLNAD